MRREYEVVVDGAFDPRGPFTDPAQAITLACQLRDKDPDSVIAVQIDDVKDDQ